MAGGDTDPVADSGAESESGFGDVDTVCFDLDDTLCRYTQRGAAVLEGAFERVGIDQLWEIEEYHDRYRDYLEASADADDLRRRCFTDLAVDAGHGPETGQAVADAYAAIRDQEAVELVPGAREAVTELAGEYRLGLITNGAPEMQRTKLEAVGLDGQFETVVCAGYETAAKPSPEPFETALEALESTPDRAVYVGNSLSSDVAGARGAGLRSAWIPVGDDAPETPDPAPTYRLETVTDLLSPPW